MTISSTETLGIRYSVTLPTYISRSQYGAIVERMLTL